ncbi:MAG TPA: VOC family protein [Candidatus Binataceae bacterium]|nr:VOC family protein [Candidatus Binataceae bacterium]
MSTIKRLDRLDIATTDLADAASIYQRNFGFAVSRGADPAVASVKIGDAEISLASGDSVAGQIAAGGEGMYALWLEADDLEAVAAAMLRAGLDPGAIRVESGRRVLAVDPKLANQVPLFIFDRKL